MAPRTIGVLLATYQRAELARTCVEALLTDDGLTEVVVVDDGSTDDTWTVLNQIADSRLHILRNEKNQGRSAARQRALASSTTDLVLLLDDDVIAGPGLASGHRRRHGDRDDQVVVGYMPVAASQTQAASRIYAQEYEGAVTTYERGQEVLAKLWGGNVSLPRTVALQAGLGDDDQDSYHEDQRFGLRCRALGLTGVFDRTLRAEHRHSRTPEAFLADAYRRGVALGPDHHRKGVVSPGLGLLQISLVRRALTALLLPVARADSVGAVFALKALRRFETERGRADTRPESLS